MNNLALGILRLAVLLAACIVLGSSGRAGAAVARGDGLSQAEVAQQQLQGSTSRVGEQLAAIVDEFERNGLGGEEVQLLGAIRGILGQLSEADMARVVTLLHQARELQDASAQRSRLVEAFGAQKGVGLKLRQILLEYQRQQELAGVSARLDELAARQHLAMRETLALAASGGARRREWLSENQRISLQLQVSEQASLKEEVVAVVQRLRTWTGEGDNEAAARATETLAGSQVSRLTTVLEAILADLNGGLLLSATGRQRESRGLLREVARELLIPPDEIEALQSAVREVDGLATRQQVLRANTLKLEDRAPMITAAAGEQADLVDDGDVARSGVATLDSAAGEQLAAAVGRMQEARGVLDASADPRARRIAATTQQELALARLASAKRLLEQRIDSLEKQREAATDPLANLRQVREDVAELLERQRELKSTAAQAEKDPAQLRPMAPKQGDLADRAADAGERASLDSMQAAEQLNEAVNQMRRSQRTLGEGQNNPGAQQAAVDALTKALEALNEELARLEAASKELAQVEDLLQRLIALIEAQQKLNDETARLARKLPGRTIPEVRKDQGELAGPTHDLEGEVPPTVPQAATYLGDAATQMVLADNELGSGLPADARVPQDEALLNLQRARRELEARLAELQRMLGQPSAEASPEDLAEMIKKAQKDVNSAMSEEELSAMSKSLQSANRQIRPATSGRMGRLPRMIRDPLQQADQALSEGSAAAEAGDQGASETQAGQAQAALAAAAAALDLAMAGMGQQPAAGEGQGGQGRAQGQGDGRGRGRQPGSQAGKGTGDAGNFFGPGGADGPRRATSGSGRFIGLPARERAALLQSQGEHYPQEYAPLIEQYLKNLSDQVSEPGPGPGPAPGR